MAERITRDDLEAKFRELEGGAAATAEELRGYVVAAAAVLAVGVVALAFLAGRRRGRRKATVVEIKRI